MTKSRTYKNILHITSTDLRGAGNAAAALNTVMNVRGYHSKLVVVFKTKNDPDIIGFIKPINRRIKILLDEIILIFHKIQTYMKAGKTDPDYYFYNLDERKSNFSAKSVLRKIDFRPDAIFIHWVSNFINTATINELSKLTQAKMYWVMVDNAPITGGCHYPWTCKGYTTDCNDCPALLTASKKYIAQRNFRLKKENFPADMQVLTFSSTDKLRAEKCNFYINRKASLIFLPINETVFRPIPKMQARKDLDLPLDKKIIFFAATDVNERRKGFAELQKALELFARKLQTAGEQITDYLLVTAGKKIPVSNSFNSVPMIYLGYLSEQDMVKAFNAATLFVCPTLEDSGPGILGQAMLCGVPTVAFATGSAVDMIQTGQTGYLAELGDSADLADGIDFIIHRNPDEYARMSVECRDTGMSTCSFEAVGERLDKLLYENEK
ncbi:MAG: glycosyltransferase [Prevotellaceae bacterium]|jgi:glycosyltransferase involved in cell wall biosynthesis|nr:glycosyltransferase [Prevotellaceae bacterium]